MRDTTCPHGNKPAELCAKCRRTRETAAVREARFLPDPADRLLRSEPQTAAQTDSRSLGKSHQNPEPLVKGLAEPPATTDGNVSEGGVSRQPHLAGQEPIYKEEPPPPGSTPRGGVVGAPAEPPPPPPLVPNLASPGSHLAEDAGEVDEVPPAHLAGPPPGANLGRGKVAGQAWGRELQPQTRTSAEYRLAVYRCGQDDYQLVEMVKEETGSWRERLVGDPDGFDVVQSRLLDRAVEWMTP